MTNDLAALEKQANRVKDRLLKKGRKCLIEMPGDVACRTVEGLEHAEAWLELTRFFSEASEELGRLANGFLEPSLRLEWVEAKLKSYETELLETNGDHFCLILSLREDREISEDFTRKILEDKLCEAADKAGVHAAATLAAARVRPVTSILIAGQPVERTYSLVTEASGSHLGKWACERLPELKILSTRMYSDNVEEADLRRNEPTSEFKVWEQVIDVLQDKKREQMFSDMKRRKWRIPELLEVLADVKGIKGSTLHDHRKRYLKMADKSRIRKPATKTTGQAYPEKHSYSHSEKHS
jgi:hypothetical protein